MEPVELESASGPLEGMAIAVDTDHVDVLAPRALSLGAELTVRLRRAAGDPAVEVRGRVSDVRNPAGSDQNLTSIEFEALTVRARAQLADLALWDARREGDDLVVMLRGRFDECTDFSPLDLDGQDRVVFDVSGIRRINSWGARAWIMFLRSLSYDLDYSFRDGSLEFVKHCNMIADMVGRGFMTSFFAPFACDPCKTEVERRLVTRDLKSNILSNPPVTRCPQCGGDEVLDDVPSRYFAFLSAAGRTTR